MSEPDKKSRTTIRVRFWEMLWSVIFLWACAEHAPYIAMLALGVITMNYIIEALMRWAHTTEDKK